MLRNVMQSAQAQGVELVRVRHLSPARVEGAHPPFVFRENLSQPIPRWQVEARVNATPFLALACVECGVIDGEAHGADCPKAPAPVQEEVPAQGDLPSLPERAYAPDAQPLPPIEEQAPAEPRSVAEPPPVATVERTFTAPAEGRSLGSVDVSPLPRQAPTQGRPQQRGRGR